MYTYVDSLLLSTIIYTINLLSHVLRYLVERVVPGNRVSVMGVYSIKKVSQGKAKKV